MFWKIVLRGSNPSGRLLAVLYARTGETIDSVRRMLDSPQGMVLQSGLSREKADALSAELPDDGSVQIVLQRDEVVCVPVLMGYRPGSRGRLRIALQKLSRLPTEEVIRFLARIPIALKLDADQATAESIKRILERAGGIVDIRSPEDLVGVSSRKNHSEPAEEAVFPDESLNSVPDEDPGIGTEFAKQETVTCTDPPSVQVKIPPLAEDVAITPLYTQPYVISFTVPASVIPPVYQTQQTFANPPKLLKETVLVYLFPVSPSDIDHTETVLSESLGLSNARVKQLIKNAPVALAGFSERIDALVAISEFAAHGIPVSLVPGSSPGMDQAPGGSLFGWLNGNERTS